MDYHILPLFSSPVVTTTITEDMSALDNFYNDFKFERTTPEQAKNCYMTECLSVLDYFPKEKQYFKEVFHQFTKNFLGFKEIEFDITTSWGVRVLSEGHSQIHQHVNCLYSSVFYLNSVTNGEGGQLEFSTNTNYPHQLLNLGPPSHYNEYNACTWKIVPEKNLFVIFPYHLRHRILTYTGQEARHSIAMNWMPFGKFGKKDGSINLSLASV